MAHMNLRATQLQSRSGSSTFLWSKIWSTIKAASLRDNECYTELHDWWNHISRCQWRCHSARLLLNQYKMDHIMQNVQDVLDRSTPCIPPHRYCVNFVPAVNKANADVKYLLLNDPSLTVDEETRQKSHCERISDVGVTECSEQRVSAAYCTHSTLWKL